MLRSRVFLATCPFSVFVSRRTVKEVLLDLLQNLILNVVPVPPGGLKRFLSQGRGDVLNFCS